MGTRGTRYLQLQRTHTIWSVDLSGLEVATSGVAGSSVLDTHHARAFTSNAGCDTKQHAHLDTAFALFDRQALQA